MKRGDFLIFGLLVLLCLLPLLLLLFPSGKADTAVVRQDGKVILRLSLQEEGEQEVLSSDGSGSNRITVEDGQVRISQADCPDGTCVRMGAISRAGETLVCLPHRLSVTIESSGEGPSGADAVTR